MDNRTEQALALLDAFHRAYDTVGSNPAALTAATRHKLNAELLSTEVPLDHKTTTVLRILTRNHNRRAQ